MILSGHQPVYLPSLLLLNKIALSDQFMFVGHCQYSPKSWQTRNYIRGHDNKPLMLSVPVQKDMGQAIDETKFAGDHWRRKHLRAIEMAYSKRPFFEPYYTGLANMIDLRWQGGWRNLGAMNTALIRDLLLYFGIKTKTTSSENITGHKTDMLISMCKATGADQYLSNEGARAYVDELAMKRAGITHRWQKFQHPVYDQGHKEFIPNLSAIDLLFNVGGEEGGKIIRSAGYVS